MEHSIKLGDCLGKGAFGSVYRVTLWPLLHTVGKVANDVNVLGP
jgi:hypothetical protein